MNLLTAPISFHLILSEQKPVSTGLFIVHTNLLHGNLSAVCSICMFNLVNACSIWSTIRVHTLYNLIAYKQGRFEIFQIFQD